MINISQVFSVLDLICLSTRQSLLFRAISHRRETKAEGSDADISSMSMLSDVKARSTCFPLAESSCWIKICLNLFKSSRHSFVWSEMCQAEQSRRGSHENKSEICFSRSFACSRLVDNFLTTFHSITLDSALSRRLITFFCFLFNYFHLKLRQTQ
jgi:hypothetical protein